MTAGWTDFHTYDWRAYARTSPDGGATWGATAPLTSTPASREDFAQGVRAAATAAGPVFAWSAWRLTEASQKAPSPLYDVVAGATGAAQRQIDGRGDRHVSAYAPAITAVPGGAVAAWQDHLRGPGDIVAARLRGSRWGRPVRVDDTGRAGWNQWRPALASTGSTVVAAWEDERDGPAQVFAARARASRIGVSR